MVQHIPPEHPVKLLADILVRLYVPHISVDGHQTAEGIIAVRLLHIAGCVNDDAVVAEVVLDVEVVRGRRKLSVGGTPERDVAAVNKDAAHRVVLVNNVAAVVGAA